MSALHRTGQDERVEILVNGALLANLMITDFSVDDDISEVVISPLGQSGTVRSQDFNGHTGAFTIIDNTTLVEATRQVILDGMVSRVPVKITLVHVIARLAGRPTTHVYTDCKLTFGRSATRGEATGLAVSFTTGNLRMAS